MSPSLQCEQVSIHACIHTYIPWEEASSNKTPQSTDSRYQKEDSYQVLSARDHKPSYYQEVALAKSILAYNFELILNIILNMRAYVYEMFIEAVQSFAIWR